MSWFDIQNKSEDNGEVHIYGEIADAKWYSEDVTPADFRDKINALKDKKRVDLYINSLGGGVFAGQTIYNMIKRFSGTVVAHVDGIAASIASVIAMAASKIHIPKNAMMMVHNPIGGAYGYADDLRKTADILDTVKQTIVDAYKEHTGLDEKRIKKMMDAETWMTGEEAVAIGFADVLEDAVDIKNCAETGGILVNGQVIRPENFKTFPKDKVSAWIKPVVNTLPAEPAAIVVPDFSLFEAQLSINKFFL